MVHFDPLQSTIHSSLPQSMVPLLSTMQSGSRCTLVDVEQIFHFSPWSTPVHGPLQPTAVHRPVQNPFHFSPRSTTVHGPLQSTAVHDPARNPFHFSQWSTQVHGPLQSTAVHDPSTIYSSLQSTSVHSPLQSCSHVYSAHYAVHIPHSTVVHSNLRSTPVLGRPLYSSPRSSLWSNPFHSGLQSTPGHFSQSSSVNGSGPRFTLIDFYPLWCTLVDRCLWSTPRCTPVDGQLWSTTVHSPRSRAVHGPVLYTVHSN